MCLSIPNDTFWHVKSIWNPHLTKTLEFLRLILENYFECNQINLKQADDEKGEALNIVIGFSFLSRKDFT
jgi:hypothetical protein